ncbi:hypothetical protein HAZT_HAZT002103 [Hyalella azteca]|uniref:DUF5641 domain-containing protein n=1 Tax=Hyalella azteca TaxID=294128 RepID=A0A6A0GNS9_HYAAZ|nr:hypothetical protein HAZT_HAZT002103 [Hyalella azteca]
MSRNLQLLELRGRREEALLRERLARDKELILSNEHLDEPLLDQGIQAPRLTGSADACSIFSDDHFDSLEPETTRRGQVTFTLREETAFRNGNCILAFKTARLHSHEERPDANDAINNTRGPRVTNSERPVEPTSAFVSRPSTSDRARPFFLGSFDASTRHLALAELKRKPANPFNGEAHVFRSWLRSLLHRVDPLQPSPWDTIDILEAHTVGAPNYLIQTFKAAHCTDPARALEVIFAKLNQRFGAGEEVALGLRRKLSSFPSVKSSATDPTVAARLRQLSDLCLVVCAHLETVPDLRTLNYASGLEPIRNKLPDFLDLKWRDVTNRYMLEHGGNHPEFAVFCRFLEEKSFTKLDGESRRLVAFSHDLCLRCMGPHSADNCSAGVSCEHCQSPYHCSALHINTGGSVDRRSRDRGEPTGNTEATQRINPRPSRSGDANHVSCCTEICGDDSVRSCSKTVLVDVSSSVTGKTLRVYAIMDEQSSNSFVSPLIFDALSLTGEVHNYFISTLSGERIKMSGRVAVGLSVRGVNESCAYELPNLFENHHIPDTTAEVATPDIVSKHAHLKHLANKFVEFDPGPCVAVLIGRDAGALLASQLVSNEAPLVYKTPLGWTVVGSICQSAGHRGDPICLKSTIHESFAASPSVSGTNVFLKFQDDECLVYSAEDRKFLNIITNNMKVSDEGNLQAPLPFKSTNTQLPDDKSAVLRRQFYTLKRLKRSLGELSECLAAMKKDIDRHHVEHVPKDKIKDAAGKAWYLPTKWHEFYLKDLQLRRKWRGEKHSLSVGDVVLIREPNCKRNEWPMGVVESVKLSSDGLVRSARIGTIGMSKIVSMQAQLASEAELKQQIEDLRHSMANKEETARVAEARLKRSKFCAQHDQKLLQAQTLIDSGAVERRTLESKIAYDQRLRDLFENDLEVMAKQVIINVATVLLDVV